MNCEILKFETWRVFFFAVNIGYIAVAIFPATKDVIKLTKISTFHRIFISLQI